MTFQPWRLVMFIKHHHAQKVYLIEVPSGARICRSETTGLTTLWIGDTAISEEPSVLLVRLAQAGKHGLGILSSQVAAIRPQC
jgi:hypothetical protein